MAFQYTLPSDVASRLEGLRYRVRQMAILRGVGVFLTLESLLLVVVVASDYFLDLEPTSRAILLSVFGALTLALGWKFLYRPASKKFSDAELASVAEQYYPKLGERVTSLVELGNPDLPENERGSKLMRELLELETIEKVGAYDFEESVPSKPAVRKFSMGVAAMMAVLLSLIIFPAVSQQLLARLFMPWGNYDSVSKLLIDIENGDRVVARGSDVTITAKVTWRSGAEEPVPEPIKLFWTNSEGDDDYRDLDFDADTMTFKTVVPNAFDSFEYYVTSEGGRSKKYKIEVVDAPEVVVAQLEVNPPGYVGLPRKQHDGVTGEITLFEHSKLSFKFEFNKPVETAEIVWAAPMVHPDSEFAHAGGENNTVEDNAEKDAAEADDDNNTDEDVQPAKVVKRTGPYSNDMILLEEVPNTKLVLSGDKKSATLEMPAEIQGSFAILLTDKHGIINDDEPHREFVVTRDQPPLLLTAGGNRDEAKPTDVYALKVGVIDDIGIGALELHVKSTADFSRVFAIPNDKLGKLSVEHEFLLDLQDLGIKHGETLTLQVRATDERPIPGVNEVWSDERIVRIHNNASAQGSNDLVAEQNDLRKELQAIKRAVVDASDNAKTLGLDADERGDEQQFVKDVGELAEQESVLTGRLQKLSERFDQHPLFANLTKKLKEDAHKPLGEAAEQIEGAIEKKADEQATELAKNATDVNGVHEKLDEIETEFEELAKLEKDLLELNRIAQRAKQLADDAKNLEAARKQLENGPRLEGETDEDRNAARQQLAEAQKQMQAEQHELAEALNRLLQARPELLAAARDHQMGKLDELAQKADELVKPQENLADALNAEVDDAAKAAEEVAAKQGDALDDIENLAAQADANQAKQPVTPIDPEVARQVIEKLKAGNLEEAEELQDQVADDLERLARELKENENLPTDPKEAAKELAKRQRALADELDKKAQELAKADPNQPNKADENDLKDLAAKEAALQMATAQLDANRDAVDEQKAAVNDAAAALQNVLDADAANKRQQQLAKAANNKPAEPNDPKANPADAQQQIAEAAKQTQESLKQAADQGRQAADALDALAKALKNPDERKAEALAQLQALRKQQDQIAQEALQNVRPNDQINNKKNDNPNKDANDANPPKPRPLDELAQDQKELAEQLAELDSPAASEQQRDAIANAAKAAQDLNREQQADVPVSQRNAQQALADLAKQLQGEKTAQEEVADLQQQQAQLAQKAAEAIKNDDQEALKDLAKQEEQLAKKAAKVDAPAAAKQQDEAQDLLEQAADELEQGDKKDIADAISQAGEALKQLNQQLQPDAQQQAAEALGQLAKKQQENADAAANQADAGDAPKDAGKQAEELADAREQVEQLRAGAEAQQEKLDVVDELRKAEEQLADIQKQLDEIQKNDPKGDQPKPQDLNDAVAENAKQQQEAADALERLEKELNGEENKPLDKDDAEKIAQEFGLDDKPGEAQDADQLADKQQELREAIEALDDEAKQETLDDLADKQEELADLAENLPKDQGAVDRADALQKMAQAKQELQQGDKQEAAAAAKQAEQALKALGRKQQAIAQAQDAQKQQAGQPENKQAGLAEQAAELAEAQRALADQLAQLNQERQGGQQPQPGQAQPGQAQQGQPGQEPQQAQAGQPQQAGQPAAQGLQQQQQELAGQAAQLALDTAEQAGEDSPAAQAAGQAALQGEEAAQSGKFGQFDQASKQGQKAAQEAQKVAEAVADQAPDLAKQAEQLADAQQKVAEQFDDLQESVDARADAQEKAQEQLAKQAQDLAQQLQDVAEQLGAPQLGAEEAGQNAQNAGQAAQQGQQAMQQVQQALQQGNSGQAADQAQQAAKSLQEAAQQAAAAGQPSGEPNAIPGELAAQVAEAARQLQQAQEQLAKAGEPGQGEPGQGEPGHGEPGHGEPGQGEPGQGEPGQGEPGQGEPGQGEPGQGEPGQGEPGQGEPGQGEPGQGQPGQGQPGQGQPGQGEPGQGQPGQGQPGQGQPGQGQPGQGQPGQGQPGQGQPGQGQPGQGQPGQGQPGQGQPGQGQPSALAQNAQALDQIAQMLNDAAQQLQPNGQQGQQPGQPGQPGQQAQNQQAQPGQPGQAGSGEGSTGTGNQQTADLSPLDVQLKRHAAKNWGQLPGKLQTEILQSAQRKANGDYAKLIKLYFQEISKASKNQKKNNR
jgi:hypothetical protein